jgi:hypothetical protein
VRDVDRHQRVERQPAAVGAHAERRSSAKPCRSPWRPPASLAGREIAPQASTA